MRLLADAAGHLGAGGFQHGLGLVAAERGQGAGQHEGLARQGQRRGGRGLALGPADAGGAQLRNHLAVVLLLEKGVDAGGHDRADVGHLREPLGAGLHDGVQGAEVTRQVLGRGLTHVPNTERVDKPRQCGLLRFLQRIEQVLRRLLAHAIQHRQTQQVQAVQVRQCLDQAGVHQLIDQLLAQAFDVHGAAAGKVQQGLFALGAAKQAPGAAVIGLALLTHGGAAAHRAVRRHAEFGRARRALVEQHAHHLGDHVAGAAHDDGVAHAHILAARLQFVVQGGVGHRHTADEHGRQLGHGRELAGATDLHVDRFHRGQFLLWRVFVRHRPARLARDEAQHALQRQAVHLVDHAVDVEWQTVTPRRDVTVKCYQLRSACGLSGKPRDRKTPCLEGKQQLPVGGEVWAAGSGRRDFAQAVGEKAERPLGGNRGVELAHRASGRIARVDEGPGGLVAGGHALAHALVEGLEVVAAHVHLATHLEHGGWLARGFAAGPPQGGTSPLGGQRTTRSGERGGT